MHTIPPASIRAAADALRAGQLVIAPTRRWYMICADAASHEACQRIFDGKRRAAGKSLVFIGPSDKDYADMFTFTSEARTLADAFWPGDLALRLPWRDPGHEARYPFVGSPALVTREDGVLGQLAATAGFPLAATSANISGDAGPDDRGPSVSPADVEAFLAQSRLDVALTLDGGICPADNHMTIIDFPAGEAILTRPGLVHRRALSAALGREI
jgi:L-threonylcarbamoyladenylate synthase